MYIERNVIVQYRNRKYYSRAMGMYLNLPAVGELILASPDLCVIDYDTKGDVTAHVLLKAQRRALKAQYLKDLNRLQAAPPIN